MIKPQTTQEQFKAMLEQAFIAGYESPIDAIDMEVACILKHYFTNVQEIADKAKRPKLTSNVNYTPQLVFDTHELYESAKSWLYGTDG